MCVPSRNPIHPESPFCDSSQLIVKLCQMPQVSSMNVPAGMVLALAPTMGSACAPCVPASTSTAVSASAVILFTSAPPFHSDPGSRPRAAGTRNLNSVRRHYRMLWGPSIAGSRPAPRGRVCAPSRRARAAGRGRKPSRRTSRGTRTHRRDASRGASPRPLPVPPTVRR